MYMIGAQDAGFPLSRPGQRHICRSVYISISIHIYHVYDRCARRWIPSIKAWPTAWHRQQTRTRRASAPAAAAPFITTSTLRFASRARPSEGPAEALALVVPVLVVPVLVQDHQDCAQDHLDCTWCDSGPPGRCSGRAGLRFNRPTRRCSLAVASCDTSHVALVCVLVVESGGGKRDVRDCVKDCTRCSLAVCLHVALVEPKA